MTTIEDIYEPPSSPPPVHAIYLPDSYYHAGTQQDDTQRHPTIRKNNYSIRRSIYTLAKKTLLLLLKNNNVLLIVNYLHKLWRQRRVVYRAFSRAIYFIQHNGYQPSLLLVFKFFQYHFMHYLVKQKVISPHHRRQAMVTRSSLTHHPIKSFFILISLIQHVSIFLFKSINKSIKNIGGFDSILFAFSTIAITKSIQQHSNTRGVQYLFLNSQKKFPQLSFNFIQ